MYSKVLQCSGEAEFHLPLALHPLEALPGSLCTLTAGTARLQDTDEDTGPKGGSINQPANLRKTRHDEGYPPLLSSTVSPPPYTPGGRIWSSISIAVVKMRSCWSWWAQIQPDWHL